jgi:TonB-dependent starch-binding outer membrane protein SusC
MKKMILLNDRHGIRWLIMLLLLLAFAPFVHAQTNLVTGTIRDENGLALPGVNILIKGTSIGTTTDGQGKFNLEASSTAVLSISFIGYGTKEMVVGNQTNIDIRLEASAEALSEIVVTGYQTQRRSDITGAIASVNLDQSKDIPGGGLMQSLQGKVAGLYIQTNGSPSGRATAVQIRGINTLVPTNQVAGTPGNGGPLYVIDGVPTTDPNIFSNMDPNTIQSMEVLKDASSASIYGSRASNGVILITTKEGKESSSLTFNTSISTQSNVRRVSMMNTMQMGEALWRGAINDGPNVPVNNQLYTYNWNGDYSNPILNSITPVPFVGGDPLTPSGNTDWQDAVYRPAVITTNSLTMTAGTGTTSALFGLAYTQNNGTVINNDYSRISGRVNVSTRLFNGRLRIGENLQLSKDTETPIPTDLGGNTVIQLTTVLQPIIPVYRTDGSFGGPVGGGFSDRNNPVHMSEINKDDKNHQFKAFGNMFAELEVLDNLVFKTSFGLDYTQNYNVNIERAFTQPAPARVINSLTETQEHFINWTWSNTATYLLVKGKHRANFLAGMEAVKSNAQSLAAGRQGFALEDVDYYVLNAGTGVISNSGTKTGNQLLSYFGNVGYVFNDKYMASVTMRYDGSSKFGENNKYGFFPAVSAGWILTNESFLSETPFFSNLKLRVGYASVGNQSGINDAARFETFAPNYGTTAGGSGIQPTGSSYSITGANTGTLASGFVKTRSANPDLKWESTAEVNVGLDFGFFKNKITGTVDYFTRQTKDILVTPPVIAAEGEGSAKTVNGATMANKGFELVLGYNGKAGEISYSINANVARAIDEITFLPASVITSYPNNAEKNILGRSSTSILGYRTDGIFKSPEEVASHATQPGKGVGRIRYKDLNGDGIINALDQDWLGTTLPDFTYGISASVRYKNFELTINTRGVQGVIVNDGSKNYTDFLGVSGITVNHGTRLLQAWNPQTNPTSTIPAMSTVNNNNEGRISDYFRVNGSYFKIQNTQLSYSMPKARIEKLRMSSLRFYALADNFLLLYRNSGTNAYTGPDPETPGILYPRPIRYTLGMDVRF